jgi:hypothetical protein
VKLAPLSTFFVNFANKICHMHCTQGYTNEFFYYKVVICNTRDKFLPAKSTKNVLRGVNYTNLKTSGGYIAKSKSQGVCLQLTQTPGGDYVIWPKTNTRPTLMSRVKQMTLSYMPHSR